MPVIIFASAVKTGLFGFNGTLLVHKYEQTTVITIYELEYTEIYNGSSNQDKIC